MTVVVRLLALIIACLSGWVVIPPSAAAAPTALSGSSGYLFSSAWASMPAHGCSESMVHIRKAWCEVSPATCTSYDRRIANGEADIAHPLGGTDATTHAEAVKGVAGRSMMVKAWGLYDHDNLARAVRSDDGAICADGAPQELGVGAQGPVLSDQRSVIATNTPDGLGEAFHYTDSKWLNSMMENGLREGTYATPTARCHHSNARWT